MPMFSKILQVQGRSNETKYIRYNIHDIQLYFTITLGFIMHTAVRASGCDII
jgi:hypothetical protein